MKHGRFLTVASRIEESNLETNIDALLLQKQPYFVGKPEAFQQSADVLLVLDSKEELPVHSTFLCAHSSVFCEILTSTSPEDGAFALRRLPLPDCTEEDVNSLLLCLYTEDPSNFLSIKSAKAVSQLAHKFGLQGTLRMCDAFFISKGNGECDASALWGDDLNAALKWIAWAEECGLPRVAKRAKRYAVENGGNISACSAVNELSRECLLWFLDARYVKKEDVERAISISTGVYTHTSVYTTSGQGTYGQGTYGRYRQRHGLPPL